MPHESNSLLLKMDKFYYKENEKEREREQQGGRERQSVLTKGKGSAGWLRKWNSVTVKASALR